MNVFVSGGVCKETDDGELACECDPEFVGRYCDTSLRRPLATSASQTQAIVIPIVVLLLLALAAGLGFFIVRKKPL